MPDTALPAKRKKPAKFKITTGSQCDVSSCSCSGIGPMIALGRYHGFVAKLTKMPRQRAARLRCGCRTFTTPAAAEEHWRGGENRGGERRPRAAELITKARAAAKAVGWKWGA